MDPVHIEASDIEGRGLRKPYGAIVRDPETGGLRLRVDDEIDEAFWLEIHIPPATLKRLLAELRPDNSGPQ